MEHTENRINNASNSNTKHFEEEISKILSDFEGYSHGELLKFIYEEGSKYNLDGSFKDIESIIRSKYIKEEIHLLEAAKKLYVIIYILENKTFREETKDFVEGFILYRNDISAEKIFKEALYFDKIIRNISIEDIKNIVLKKGETSLKCTKILEKELTDRRPSEIYLNE